MNFTFTTNKMRVFLECDKLSTIHRSLGSPQRVYDTSFVRGTRLRGLAWELAVIILISIPTTYKGFWDRTFHHATLCLWAGGNSLPVKNRSLLLWYFILPSLMALFCSFSTVLQSMIEKKTKEILLKEGRKSWDICHPGLQNQNWRNYLSSPKNHNQWRIQELSMLGWGFEWRIIFISGANEHS